MIKMSSFDKYLITGFSGFVSKHFIDFLESNKINAEVLGVDIQDADFNYKDYSFVKCNFQKADLLKIEGKGLIIKVIAREPKQSHT